MKKIQPTIKNSDFYLVRVHPERFDSLTEEGRENNPEFVLYTAAYRSGDGTDCTNFATESLKNYCIENKETLYKTDIYRNGAIAIFGEHIWDEEQPSD